MTPGTCRYIAIAAALFALARCAAIARVYNHTTDELSHIAGAVGLYESGRNLYMVEHPTLQRLVGGLALKAAGVEYPPARGLTEIPARNQANAAGADIVFHGKVPYWTVLAIARRANLVFAAILFLYTYLLGRYLAGPLAGMLGVVFLSFDANILAHSALVTTDIPAAAGFLAATYHALRFIARPNWRTTTCAAVALGLAMSCKFTCALLAPAILIVIAIRAYRHGRFWAGVPRPKYLVAIPCIAFVTLWATYLFNVGRLQDQHLFEDQKTWVRIPASVKAMTIPMPSMALGMMFMGAIGKTGFPCYFNGRLDFNGHLAYFPEALALKSPTGLVIAFVLAILACGFAFRRFRKSIVPLCLLLPPIFLLLTAMTGKLQIGIRHILPVIPFIYLFTVIYLRRGRWIWALMPLIALSALETARVHPDYLPFFNAIAGGPSNGSKYLADSNLDWGQDAARLANYLHASGRSDYTIRLSGARVPDLAAFLGLDSASLWHDYDALRQHPHGLFAISINARLGLEDFKKEDNGTPVHGPDFSWLKNHPIIARIGYSIEVYDLDAAATK